MDKYVLIPCKLDEHGKYIPNKPPHGYHHIVRVYTDGSWWPVATIQGTLSNETAIAVAKVLAGDLPFVVDPDFYAAH